MDRTVARKTTLEAQDEACCFSLSFDDRLRVVEELNRQGRILAGYAPDAPMNRKIVRVARRSA